MPSGESPIGTEPEGKTIVDRKEIGVLVQAGLAPWLAAFSQTGQALAVVEEKIEPFRPHAEILGQAPFEADACHTTSCRDIFVIRVAVLIRVTPARACRNFRIQIGEPARDVEQYVAVGPTDPTTQSGKVVRIGDVVLFPYTRIAPV